MVLFVHDRGQTNPTSSYQEHLPHTPGPHASPDGRRSTKSSTSIHDKGRLQDIGQKWLRPILTSWNNEIYPIRQEPNIIHSSTPTIGKSHRLQRLSQEVPCFHTNDQQVLSSCIMQTRTLSIDHLKSASFVAQVNRKFLLCKTILDNVCNGDKNLLILLDQHATSERIQYEELLKGLCKRDLARPLNNVTVNTGASAWFDTYVLKQPMIVNIDRTEYTSLRESATYFGVWGILYDLTFDDEELGTRLLIKTLPPLIVNQCCANPASVLDIIRSATRQGQNLTFAADRLRAGPNTMDTSLVEKRWVLDIGYCPPGLIELVKSRACRSAVMFNDHLASSQCQDLLEGLAACRFPFICAHGRISVIPLTSILDPLFPATLKSNFRSHSVDRRNPGRTSREDELSMTQVGPSLYTKVQFGKP